jgi:hypothetical protein
MDLTKSIDAYSFADEAKPIFWGRNDRLPFQKLPAAFLGAVVLLTTFFEMTFMVVVRKGFLGGQVDREK